MKAEITFSDPEITKQALLLDGVYIGPNRLNVQISLPKFELSRPNKPTFKTLIKEREKDELQNLFVSNVPKSLDEIAVRRVFARFGKVSSMKLVNKPKFSTNVAYVGYFVHSQAARAMKFAC